MLLLGNDTPFTQFLNRAGSVLVLGGLCRVVSLRQGSAVLSDAGCTLVSSEGPSASSAWSGASK